jgi:LPS O-antigen subunit length determinant protein (WzzB/FepE family)
MANDKFYGYNRKPAKTKGNPGNIDLEFESINPYEFKKGMNYELNKLGVLSLREASEEDREKATESVIKNLNGTHSAYYSYLEHYETTTRNMDKKPSFNTFLKEIEGYSMKEVKDIFDNDKMKEIKLRESIRAEVRNKINEFLKK